MLSPVLVYMICLVGNSNTFFTRRQITGHDFTIFVNHFVFNKSNTTEIYGSDSMVSKPVGLNFLLQGAYLLTWLFYFTNYVRYL